MGPADALLGEFRTAGRTLFSLGLVKGANGNLSVSDGNRLVITRAGCSLAGLSPDDVLEGSLDGPPAGASSDLALHLAAYRQRGPGAVAHAHPPGTVPEEVGPGTPHGRYAHASSLAEAVAELVREARDGGAT
ncbi:MAG: class II aldolase/adducin family protein [Actinomycetota bacterium]|nr:class II aldolase/adducin family protein [Actinomycetota bacterium]